MVMRNRVGRLHELFETVKLVATLAHPFSIPYEPPNLYLFRGPRFGDLRRVRSISKRCG
jgi:hypothetical protein